MKSDFYALAGLTKRGIKIFLKDKAGVFFSLLAPLIVLMLYVIFLGDVQLDSLKAYLSGAEVPESLAKVFVDGWMLAGVLSVACITVPFSAQSILVRDRESGNMSDMLVSPIKRHIVGLSYLTSVFAVSLCICFAVLIVAFVYLALTGWYLSAKDVFGIVGLTALSALFAALLSVIICSFISTQGAHGAFTGIMSAAIGFLVGAYMPLSMFPKAVRFGALLLPGTYSAGAFRNLFMRGALEEISSLSVQAAEGLREGFSMNLDFFGRSIGMSSQLWLFVASTAVVAAIVFGLRLAFFKGTSFLTPAGRKKGK